MYTPVNPSFYYIKVGFKRVKITIVFFALFHHSGFDNMYFTVMF